MEILDRIALLENKEEIKRLTHSYLAAADQQDSQAMAAHFAPDGVLKSIMDGQTIVLEGSQKISEGFEKILAPISKAYHLAGQLLIDLEGNNARGTSYTFVTLVSSMDDQQYVRKIWAVYKDEYIKHDNRWLIQNRIATVEWEEKNIIIN